MCWLINPQDFKNQIATCFVIGVCLVGEPARLPTRNTNQGVGFSFRELAAQCNVDHSDIAKYENGEKNLTFHTMLELASGLGVHPKELFD